MMEATPTRGEQTRAEILQAAHALFIEQGYHGTSMRQIAKEAGVALGGLYNHFNSKDDIFLAVLEAHHPYHEILPALNSAQGDTVEAFVQNAADSLVAALDNNPDFLNLMLVEIVEFKSAHVPQLFERLFPQFLSLAQNFAARQNKLRPIPVALILRAFIGLFFSFYITESLLGGKLPPESQENGLEHFVDIFLFGIVSRE